MNKIALIFVITIVFLFPALAFAEENDNGSESELNVNIGIGSENANVGISSGDDSTYGIHSGERSRFYINGQDLDDMFKKSNGTSQFGPPPQGTFTQNDVSLPMPPPPASPQVQTVAMPAPAANYDAEIQELYNMVDMAFEEREILADALVQAISIIEEMEGELDDLYASSLTVDPEPPATDPDEMTLDSMVQMQNDELSLLKMRLLINDVVTYLLLLFSIIFAIRYRNVLAGKDSTRAEYYSRSHSA